jgi:hypothetical protein
MAHEQRENTKVYRSSSNRIKAGLFRLSRLVPQVLIKAPYLKRDGMSWGNVPVGAREKLCYRAQIDCLKKVRDIMAPYIGRDKYLLTIQPVILHIPEIKPVSLQKLISHPKCGRGKYYLFALQNKSESKDILKRTSLAWNDFLLLCRDWLSPNNRVLANVYFGHFTDSCEKWCQTLMPCLSNLRSVLRRLSIY